MVVRDGTVIPTVRFYAVRDVEVGEELTFDYGALGFGEGTSSAGSGEGKTPGQPLGGRLCLCGEAACRGFLPFNTTHD